MQFSSNPYISWYNSPSYQEGVRGVAHKERSTNSNISWYNSPSYQEGVGDVVHKLLSFLNFYCFLVLPPLKMRVLLIVFLLSISIVYPWNNKPDDEMPYFENILIVKVAKDINIKDAVVHITNKADINVINIDREYSFFDDRFDDQYGLGRIFRLVFDDEADPLEFCHLFKNNDYFEYVEPLYKHEQTRIPNDPLYINQYELRAIQMEECWDISTGDPRVTIAIVDSELDWRHRDLSGNIFLNPGEEGIDNQGKDKRFNGIDDDLNGFIDDYHGWDFMSNTTYAELLEGNIKQDNDPRINEQGANSYHGTSVASVCSALSDNDRGIASPGWSCRLLPVKIRSDYGIGGAEHQGILYAAMLGADVINCSWVGVGFSQNERDVVNQAVSMGSLIIASAGNSGVSIDKNYYINSQNVMYIGSSDKNDVVADFSDYGIITAVFAPGKDIQCASPFDNYTISTGTSLSAPIVSGVAGLIKSIHPDWSNYQIWHQLRSTSDNIFAGNDKNREEYYGRLNAYKCLQFNESFESELSIPGLRFTDHQILTESGEIDTYDPFLVKLDLINYLAPAEDLIITVEPLDGLLISESKFSIQKIRTLEEMDAVFQLKLSDNAKWYDKASYLLIRYKAGEYEDFQLLKLEIAPPSLKEFSAEGKLIDSLRDDIGETLRPYVIYSPNIDMCWITGINAEYRPFYALANSDGVIKKGYFGEDIYGSPVELFAIDERTCFAFLFISGESNTIWKTTDAGDHWQKIKLDRFIEYVPVIKFFNQKYGFALASYTNDFDYKLIESKDFGSSWMKTELLLDEDESAIPIKQNGRNIIITNKNSIFETKDLGRSWVKKQELLDTVYRYQGIIYSKDDKAALVAYRNDDLDYNSYFAYSQQELSLWSVQDNINISNILGEPPYDNFFSIPTSQKYAIFSNINSLIITDDFGMNWYPIKNNISKYFSDNTEQITSFSLSGNKARLWIVDDMGQIAYLDLDNVFLPPDNTKTEMIPYHKAFPNPSYDNLVIQYYLSINSEVKLRIIDLYGRELYRNGFLAEAFTYYNANIEISAFADGIYFYSIEAGGSISSGQILVLKAKY